MTSWEVHGVCIPSVLASVSPLCELGQSTLAFLDFRSSSINAINHAYFAGLMGKLNVIMFVGLLVIVGFNCHSYYCNIHFNKSCRHHVLWMVTQKFDIPGLFFKEGINCLFQ